MKLFKGHLHPNTVMLCCTIGIMAALLWNVQANRYRFSEKGYIFDAISLSFYDPHSKQWIEIIERD